MEHPLLTVAEAGRMVWPDVAPRIGARRLYRWVANGTIPAEAIVRPGRVLFLRRAVFTSWLERGHVNGNGSTI